jgi:hypothetical protein
VHSSAKADELPGDDEECPRDTEVRGACAGDPVCAGKEEEEGR